MPAPLDAGPLLLRSDSALMLFLPPLPPPTPPSAFLARFFATAIDWANARQAFFAQLGMALQGVVSGPAPVHAAPAEQAIAAQAAEAMEVEVVLAEQAAVAPAADAIDPGLLAAIEDGLEQKLVDEVRHRVVTELTRRLRS